MKRIYYLLMIILASCAKIPAESVQLSEAMQSEGKRMHRLNIALLHTMFKEKKQVIDAFIQDEYTPALAENFKKLLPPDADLHKDLVAIIQYITPAIQVKRDSLLHVLTVQETKLVSQLEDGYIAFDKGNEAMNRLLRSAVKKGEARKELYASIKAMSDGRIDIEKIEAAINDFIRNAGNVTVANAILEKIINTMLYQSKNDYGK